MTKSARPTVAELPIALHIPVSVLAQMPEKLRLLGVTISACSVLRRRQRHSQLHRQRHRRTLGPGQRRHEDHRRRCQFSHPHPSTTPHHLPATNPRSLRSDACGDEMRALCGSSATKP